MFNVLTDSLPDKWDGWRINTDYEYGIKMSQLLSDTDLSIEERLLAAVMIFYIDNPDDMQSAVDGLQWFLNGWNHDNHDNSSKSSVAVMDFDVDQWRIYAAFRAQYKIDLTRTRMHWFVFMGLLSNLWECTFTEVVNIRQKKITSKMSPAEKKEIAKAKKIYQIKKEDTVPLSEEEKKRDELAIAEFNKLRQSHRA